MRGRSSFLLSAIICVSHFGATKASEFWFATSEISGAPGPATLSACVCGEPGSLYDIHVWAQPDSQASLRNFSLNLTSSNTAAIDFTSVEINNSGSINERFQFVFDSTSTASLTAINIENAPDRILGIQGFTILPTGNTTYEGLSSTAALVTIAFEPMSAGVTNLQLSTGSNGINSDGQSTSAHVANFFNAVLSVHNLTADFNRDNIVNQSDLQVWNLNFGTSFGADCSVGDADFDGDVDGTDLLILQRNYSRIGSPMTAATTVPEPGTMLAFFVGLLSISGTPARRRRPYYRRAANWMLVIGLCLCLISQKAQAQQFANWNVASGDWSNEVNWNPQVIPSVLIEFDSAQIDNGGTASVSFSVNTINQLKVTDGQLILRTNSDLDLIGSATVDSQGVISLESDSDIIFSAPDEFLSLSGGKIIGEGTVTFDAGAIVNHGEVSPESAKNVLGSLTINGDYTQFVDGTLRLDVRGNVYEQLIVNGTARLGGNLIVDFGGLSAGVGVFIPFFDGSVTVEEQFDQVMFINTPVGEICQGYNLDFPGTQGFWAGDMNLDGVVSAEDVQLFALALVNPSAYEDNRAANPSADGYRYEVLASHMGNVDQLGNFNFDDIEAFAMKANMSISAVVDAINATQRGIPEPGSATLLLLTLATSLGLRRPFCHRPRD